MKNIFYLMVSVIVIGASVIYACSREEFHGASEYHPSRVEQSYVQLQNDLIWLHRQVGSDYQRLAYITNDY